MRVFGKSLRVVILGLSLLVGVTGLAEARDRLTLRVNDSIAAPGGLAAIVIRTYSSRPINQGQLCFIARSGNASAGGQTGPFASLESYRVFSQRNDGLSVAEMEVSQNGQVIVMQFSSRSSSVNQTDGPLAVLYFRLRDGVQPGKQFRISIDTKNTALFGRNGNPIPVEPREGRLRVRSLAAPFLAEAESDKIAPGEAAELGLETYEPVPMASGSIGLRYDPAIATGRPKVKMRKKYGKRTFAVDRSTPGLVLVEFQSPNGKWNRVPGEILSVKLRTRRDVAVGTRSTISVDESLTFFIDPSGDVLRYRFENGKLEFRSRKKDDGGGGDDD